LHHRATSNKVHNIKSEIVDSNFAPGARRYVSSSSPVDLDET